MVSIKKICTIDKMGRIVIPVSIRKAISADIGDQLELSLENDILTVKKAISTCVFCNQANDNMKLVNGKYICADCLNSLKD